MLEGLQGLKQAGLRLACVTNKPLSFTRPLLAAKGLDGLFEQVFGGDSFARKNRTRCHCSKPVKRWAQYLHAR